MRAPFAPCAASVCEQGTGFGAARHSGQEGLLPSAQLLSLSSANYNHTHCIHSTGLCQAAQVSARPPHTPAHENSSRRCVPTTHHRKTMAAIADKKTATNGVKDEKLEVNIAGDVTELIGTYAVCWGAAAGREARGAAEQGSIEAPRLCMLLRCCMHRPRPHANPSPHPTPFHRQHPHGVPEARD